MSEVIQLAGDPVVAVHLRRSDRARRLSLRVSRLDGRVTLTAPAHVSGRQVDAFLRDRGDWVRGHLKDQPTPLAVTPGLRLPVQGEALVLTADRRRSALRDGSRLLVSPERAAAQAKVWLQSVARDRLSDVCDRHAATLERSYTQLVLRDTRSRWGSCSSAGRLMFSWRLVMAPARILDYVAAHEVAHLVEMNHAPAFWAVVDRLHPAWQHDRDWLRRNGAWLHRYRFEGDTP